VLKDAAYGSFLSAVLARDIIPQMAGMVAEGRFIGAMFQVLGRHLAMHYLPE
jgi:hypothetical protein